ncbi:gamma-glutamyltranspeptidase [Aulographum hederae CBS 113979]|uniref:Gamma-glutamyltranspeptidase n=1 Tax=Aulographum hederae CBS 113979 TaxID=1176131 RepID=A0A6G1GZG8_9PEZI|nr:gamma-glutamyltranspeptidase [Aulographum hederae CBS 113979]
MPVLNDANIYPAADPEFTSFPSRRSVVHSTKGIVSCTQPLAAQAGARILREGGNAADAAVATAAALNMTEPGSTGIGGDMFCLFFDAKIKKVHALNGSGRAGSQTSLEQIRNDLKIPDGQTGSIPMSSVHSVTIPGAAAGWVDTVEKFGSGKLSMEQILMPAIELGEEGFPVSEVMSTYWSSSEKTIKTASPNGAEMLKKDTNAPDGCRAPRPGEIMKNPTLSNTFQLLAKHGKKGFYEGSVAEALVKVVQDLGGHIVLDDLKNHSEMGSEEVDAISLKFEGQGVEDVEVWEHPPNGQGIVALMALGMLEKLEKDGKIRKWKKEEHNSADHLHAIIETLRIAFADATWWITDPSLSPVPTTSLLSPSYLAQRSTLFHPTAANTTLLTHGSPAHNHSDTVYFATTDSAGNACSFINSNYGGFGTCIIPSACGFTLQNRGANFSLDAEHPNCYAPRKRPYHTIIPALITRPSDGQLHSVYGVMGGFMQPQGHVQVLLNMLAFGYSPQAALDAPRVCIGAGMPTEEGDVWDRTVYVEDGVTEEVVEKLREMGHTIEVVKGHGRGLFGRGQVIRRHEDEGQLVWSAGSDMRADGCAIPQ